MAQSEYTQLCSGNDVVPVPGSTTAVRCRAEPPPTCPSGTTAFPVLNSTMTQSILCVPTTVQPYAVQQPTSPTQWPCTSAEDFFVTGLTAPNLQCIPASSATASADTSSLPIPPPPMTNLPGIATAGMSSAAQLFNTVLDQYRTSLTYYKLTGNSSVKPQVDTYKQWLDSYVAALQNQGDQQATQIQSFVSEYQTTNPDLLEMQRRMKDIQVEGPRLQDAYETEMAAQVEPPFDHTTHYVKAGLIAGVLAMVAALSVF